MKRIPYCGSTVLDWPVNLIIVWHFLFGTGEMIHIFICKEKNCNNNGENIR